MSNALFFERTSASNHLFSEKAYPSQRDDGTCQIWRSDIICLDVIVKHVLFKIRLFDDSCVADKISNGVAVIKKNNFTHYCD